MLEPADPAGAEVAAVAMLSRKLLDEDAVAGWLGRIEDAAWATR